MDSSAHDRAVLPPHVWQFVRFGIVGAITTLIDVTIFAGAVQIGVNAAFATACSYGLAATVSFLLNRSWSFRTDRAGNARAQATRFALVQAGMLSLSSLTVGALTLALAPLPAKLVSVGLIFFLNYSVSRRWIFL